MALWKSIYQPHADKLHDKLGSYHPDFICELTRFQPLDPFLPVFAHGICRRKRKKKVHAIGLMMVLVIMIPFFVLS